MKRNKSEAALLEYLKEHLSYERTMLGFTYRMLFQSGGLRWCAFFESFGIHARNLYDFLRHEGKASTTFRADDYAPKHRKPAPSNVDGKMNRSFFHLSASRLDNNPVSLADAVAIGSWIDREWAKWASDLKEPFLAEVDSSAVCPPHPSSNGGQPSATNQPRTPGFK